MMRVLAVLGFVLASFWGGAVHATRDYPTDLWAILDSIPVEGYIHVHIYAHSTGNIACQGGIGRTAGGPNLWTIQGETMANGDGIIAMEGDIAAKAPAGRYWVNLTCYYPQESGQETTNHLSTSFGFPAKQITANPPPPLTAWISPPQPTYKANLTLFAKTAPGALCTVDFEEDGHYIPGWPHRIGKSGVTAWSWTYQGQGTSTVTCDARKAYSQAQVTY